MIRVDDKWVITMDSMNYMPRRDYHRMAKVTKEDGTVREEPVYGMPIGYYSDLKSAVRAIARKEYKDALLDKEAVPLREAVGLIEETVNRFEKILEEIRE